MKKYFTYKINFRIISHTCMCMCHLIWSGNAIAPPSVLGQALQSLGNRDSLPALKPTGQSAADSPKGSRQVLADVAGHLEPEQRSAAATVSRRIAFFIKDSESSATRRDLFDNFLYNIRSPLHLSRLHKYFQLPTCSTQARRLHKTGLQP